MAGVVSVPSRGLSLINIALSDTRKSDKQPYLVSVPSRGLSLINWGTSAFLSS